MKDYLFGNDAKTVVEFGIWVLSQALEHQNCKKEKEE